MTVEAIIAAVVAVLIAVLVLTVWTNIVVAITKKVVAWDKFPTEVWVFIVALASTIVAVAAAAAIFKVAMLWYYWVGAVVVALCVCYAAMYGYDNFYAHIWETIKKIREIIAGKNEQ